MADEQHSSDDLAYLTCDGKHLGPGWRAYWVGDRFRHVQEEGGGSHEDDKIVYQTWDETCWSTSWDASRRMFLHKRFPGGEDQHYDAIINYLTFDRCLWTATRDGKGWFHVKIADANPGPSKNVIDQIEHWLDRNKKAIGLAKAIYQALQKYSEQNR